MQTLISNMGQKIRETRRGKKLTLRDVSHMTGLTESLLSQIENSKANPSITTLLAISKALDTPVGVFFETGEDTTGPVVRRDERPVGRTANGITYYPLMRGIEDKMLEVLYTEFQPGADTTEFITHKGIECGIVLSGKIEVCVEDEIHVLNEGDAITIESTRPHKIRNISDQVATTIWIDSPPTF